MNITDYLKSRHKTIDASIAAEVLAGNQFKEACERAAKAEITALECAIGSGEVPSPGTTWTAEQVIKYFLTWDTVYDAIRYVNDPKTGIKAVTDKKKGV